ncbi:hypothetical protein GGI35DRAFT_18875 [Trichoderma velutinum]
MKHPGSQSVWRIRSSTGSGVCTEYHRRLLIILAFSINRSRDRRHGGIIHLHRFDTCMRCMAVHFTAHRSSFMLQWYRVQITPAAAAMDVNRHARVSPPDAQAYFEIGHFIQTSERRWQHHSHPTEQLSEEFDLNVAAKLPMNRRYNRDSIDRKADPRRLEIRYSVFRTPYPSQSSRSIVALTGLAVQPSSRGMPEFWQLALSRDMDVCVE